MSRITIALLLCVMMAGTAGAREPIRSVGPFGPPNPLPGGRNVCFSEPPDLNGELGSSEIISAFGLETRIAGAFSLDAGETICLARWWGGCFNNEHGCADNEVTTFNLYFYEDGNCLPTGEPFANFTVTPTITPAGCESGVYPIYKYEAAISRALSGDVIYWFVAQAGDHAFPPQWGRLTPPPHLYGPCNALAFWSPFFGYPEWTSDCGLDPCPEISAELECNCPPVPATPTSWGRIKGLYR